jgi:hypothetical protein
MKIQTVSSLVLVIAGAACSSSSVPGLNCPAICNQAKQCNPNVLVDVCQNDCVATADMLVDSAQQTISTCSGSCAELSACQSGAIEQCASTNEDVSPWLERLCTAATDCPGSTISASRCADGITEADRAGLRCFSTAARERMLTCARTKCGLPDAVLDCGREVLPLFEELATGFAN